MQHNYQYGFQKVGSRIAIVFNRNKKQCFKLNSKDYKKFTYSWNMIFILLKISIKELFRLYHVAFFPFGKFNLFFTEQAFLILLYMCCLHSWNYIYRLHWSVNGPVYLSFRVPEAVCFLFCFVSYHLSVSRDSFTLWHTITFISIIVAPPVLILPLSHILLQCYAFSCR